MDLNITNLGITGLLGLIILVATVMGFIKGFARMFFGLISITLGALGAYWGFTRGGPMLHNYFSEPPSWLPAAAGLVVGLALIYLSRMILGTMLKPVKLVDGKKQNHAGMGGIFGIATGTALVFFGISSIRYLGTIAEIDRLDRAIGEKTIDKKVSVSPFIYAKNFLDSTKPGQIHQGFDPINDPARAQLAKLKVLTQEQHAINVAAGTNLTVHKALSNEKVRELLASTPDLEAAYFENKQWGYLLSSERLKTTARLPEAKEVLLTAEIEKSLGIEPAPLFPEPDPKEKKEKDQKTAKK